MVFVGGGLIAPRIGSGRLAVAAFGIACLDELSQLFHPEWLDEAGATTLGHLVLGSRFGWRDLVAYAVGVAIGLGADRLCCAASAILSRRHTVSR